MSRHGPTTAYRCTASGRGRRTSLARTGRSSCRSPRSLLAPGWHCRSARCSRARRPTRSWRRSPPPDLKGSGPLKVWVDLTNSPHVLVLAPIIRRLQQQGHEVQVTARDFAQTLELCERLGIGYYAIGHHRGAALTDKARGLADRSFQLVKFASRRGFDLAIGHGSNDISVAARLLRIPCSTMFDYEWATVQHNVNCRLAQAVVVPDAIPPERFDRYGARGKLHPCAGRH